MSYRLTDVSLMQALASLTSEKPPVLIMHLYVLRVPCLFQYIY